MSDKLILVSGNTMLWLYSTPLLPRLLERRWTHLGPFYSDILFTPLNGGFNGKNKTKHIFENRAAACETALPPAVRQLCNAQDGCALSIPGFTEGGSATAEGARLASCVSRSELADRAICCRVESSMRRATGAVQRPLYCLGSSLENGFHVFLLSLAPSHHPPQKKKGAHQIGAAPSATAFRPFPSAGAGGAGSCSRGRLKVSAPHGRNIVPRASIAVVPRHPLSTSYTSSSIPSLLS